MRIYLVGPITGMGYDDVVTAIEEKAYELRLMGYDIIHPMMGKEYLRNELEFKSQGYLNPVSTNHAIFNRDRWCVGNSDIILADFTDGDQRVSIGSVFELAWAAELHKHVIVVMGTDNIHNHAFVLEAADIVFSTLGDAMKYLQDLSRTL